MNTPTPRTDELERELTAAREKLAEWKILNGWGGTPEIINDFIKGQQTRIHYAQNLEEELTAVTEQRDKLAYALDRITISGGGIFCRQIADEALQSLNQPTEL